MRPGSRARRCPESCDSTVRVANPSDLHAALDGTSGTVTEFLDQLVGEGIVAHAWHHEMIGARASDDVLVEESQPLLHRAATLRGCISGCSYVYAESVIVTSRLPAGLSHRLESTSDPIGRILHEVGIVVSREDLVHPYGPMVSRPWNANATVAITCLPGAIASTLNRPP